LTTWRTPLDLPLALFILSGLAGAWISYDPAAGWSKLLLIGLAVVLYYLIVYSGRFVAPAATHEASEFKRRLPLQVLIWALVITSAIFAIYFVTQYDYASGPNKFGPITQVGLSLNRLLPRFPFPGLQPNNTAGVLELGLPLSFALALHPARSRGRTALVAALAATLLIGFGVLMTASRGAWLALAVVAGVSLFIITSRHRPARLLLPAGLIVLLTLAIAGLRWAAQSQPAAGGILERLPGNGNDFPRPELYGQVWHLIQDYPFTGSGLATFPMVYSTYALLINVPFLPHAHNWFLQIWIEQGMLGIAAFMWLVVAFFIWAWRRRKELSWLGLGGVAASTTMLLHGLVDAPLAYSSWALPFMFVPMGFAVADGQKLIGDSALAPHGHDAQFVSRYMLAALGLGALVLVTAGLIAAAARSQLAAMWFANMGSVAETRVELGSYSFPDSLVEYTRRNCGLQNDKCELSAAEGYLQEALAYDSGNVTANQRLAEIDLARGQYDDALAYSQSAYTRDTNNPVTWQLLGDAYLALGRNDEAYAFWSRVGDAAAKLDIEASVRYEKSGDYERAGWARQLAERVRKGEAIASQ
jgi:O-Antigen ligase/Tetratricopeptide repeat